MDNWRVVSRLLMVLVVGAGCIGAFYVGTAARSYLGPGVTAAYAEDPPPGIELEETAEVAAIPRVVAERLWVDDQEQGLLKVEDDVVLHIQTASSGLTGYERAIIVAKRLEDALVAGAGPGDIAVQQLAGMWVVMIGETPLITINAEEADQLDVTLVELAAQWAMDLAAAFAEAPAEEETEEQIAEEPTEEAEDVEDPEEVAEETEADWQPPEPYKDKIVPIVSVLEGVRIGIARVNGPQSAVNQVQAVAQIETHYKNTLEIDVYVPISTKVPGQNLARVQGVGVTGLGDYRF